MAQQKNKDKLVISEVKVTSPRNKEGDPIIYVSFTVEKNSLGIPDLPFVIKSHSLKNDLTGETDEFGYGSVNFTTKDSKVSATVFIKYEDEQSNKKQLKKSSKEYTIREEKQKSSGESFYKDLTPIDGANSIISWGELDDKTCDTDRAFNLLKEWLKTKTVYEKTWFISAFNQARKANKETTMNFMEQFINYHHKNDGNKEKDQLAKNMGLLPLVDQFKSFNNHINNLFTIDSEIHEKIIELLSGVTADKVNNFHFHCSYLSEIEFITIIKNIAASKNPKKAAEIRGFFNKQRR